MFLSGRIAVQMPKDLPKADVEEILFGDTPEGCLPTKVLMSGVSSALPTENLYILEVEEGKEGAWIKHLMAKRTKWKYVYAYPCPSEARAALHRHPRIRMH